MFVVDDPEINIKYQTMIYICKRSFAGLTNFLVRLIT